MCFTKLTIMKLLMIFIIAFSYLLPDAFPQKITINTQTKRVEGHNYRGYESDIRGDYEDIKSNWLKLLRKKAKLKTRRNHYQIDELALLNMGMVVTGFSKISSNDSTVNIWLALNPEEILEDTVELVNNELESLLYNFTFEHYKSGIQKQINDAERAATFTSRKHQQLIQEAKSMDIKLLDVQNEKKKLEESLISIELELQVLLQRIENNKTDQETAYKDLEEIKKVLEGYKEKLKKLGQ